MIFHIITVLTVFFYQINSENVKKMYPKLLFVFSFIGIGQYTANFHDYYI